MSALGAGCPNVKAYTGKCVSCFKPKVLEMTEWHNAAVGHAVNPRSVQANMIFCAI